jgi:DNA polymerase-1
VYPDQVVDYKALRGDTSDCIPGIRGIGEKTAAMLLGRYYTLEKLLENCENIPEKAVREKICAGHEIAKMSQFLATIVQDVDVDFDFEKAKIEPPNVSKATEFLRKMQFYSFLKNINPLLATFNVNAGEVHTEQEHKEQKEAPSQPPQSSQLGLFATTQEKDYEVVSDIREFENEDLVAFKIIGDQVVLALEKKVMMTGLEKAKHILEDEKIKKTTADVKSQFKYTDLKNVVFDVVLAAYIKDPARKNTVDIQAIDIFNLFVNNIQDEVSAIFKLTKYWQKKLNEDELHLLSTMELPLSKVLSDMERVGVSVDIQYLKELTTSMDKTLAQLETEIYALAGVKFNINSPKQVGEILFEKLGLKSKKKKISTSAEILESLALDYEIAAKILSYRKFSKLKSTYTQALPTLINPVDGRIHTSYNQTVTTTGRLSSSNPNLQNIPIRSEEGGKIRAAFIPKDRENYLMLSADYSQIELRLLAHVSGDKNLREAFLENIDIHTLTAARVFEVPIEDVTKEMRRKAKAVNFGIIYGQSKYGLAKSLGITNEEADDFIRKYFKTYPLVKKYMDDTVISAQLLGYVETIYKRRRYLAAELNSSNGQVREFAKRAAINQPMQGTAADLIKMAMIEFSRALQKNNLKSKMIMQVHDEIVVEVEKSEIELVKKLIIESMELGQPLSVPLVVDVSVGATWEK